MRAKRIISKVSYLYSSYPQICVKEFGSCGVEKKSMAESISNSQLRYMGRPSHNKSPKTKIIISNLSPSQRNYELPFAPYTNSHFSTFSYNEVASTNIFFFLLPLPYIDLALSSLIVTESEIKTLSF